MTRIQAATSEHIRHIWLNRPKVRNAIDRAMVAEIRSEIAASQADRRIYMVVIAGRGSNFSSGADLREISRFRRANEALDWVADGQAMLNEIEACQKPVIAAVEGAVIAGGLELALACDLRIATETAYFGSTELRIGSIAAWGGTQRLSRLVGPGRAKEMVLLCRHVNASEAQSIGLVAKVCAVGALDDLIADVGRQLKSQPLRALTESKRSINRALDFTLANNLELDAAVFAALAFGHDFREGVAAFLESRPPVFEYDSP